MNKAIKLILSTIVLLLVVKLGFSQDPTILYIVDSVPEYKADSSYLDHIKNHIHTVKVVADPKIIKNSGYEDFDGLVYVFTKAFDKRSERIKAIPSRKQMQYIDGKYYYKNMQIPYSGPFITYYDFGEKKEEGKFYQGKAEGGVKQFYRDGGLWSEFEYKQGSTNGPFVIYYKNGSRHQVGEIKNDVYIGLYKTYHGNGQLATLRTLNESGKLEGEAFEYYSTGKLKNKMEYVNGKYVRDSIQKQVHQMMREVKVLENEKEYSQAIILLNDVIQLKPDLEDAYFIRGVMRQSILEYNEAIEDFDKTIEIEPSFAKAYSNRGMTMIWRVEKDLNIADGNSKISIFSKEELSQICQDLNRAIELGLKSPVVQQSLEKYCK